MTAAVLIYGYGNPGRLDDGLGPALVHELNARGLGGRATLETGYQLQLEDAELVARHDVVVFVDADARCAAPFQLRRIAPAATSAFSTHAVAPAAVLALAREHFDCRTAGLVLGIRGYDFDAFGERLSARARRNLAAAADFMGRALQDGDLVREAAPTGPEGGSHDRA